MLASLLPGIRQVRAPLAAGYIWLVFVFLAAGAPTSAADAPRPLQQLLRVMPELGQPATAVAVSFVAYLIGSLSLDLFGLVLPRGVDLASQRFRHRGGPLVRDRFAEDVQSSLDHARDAATQLHDIQMKVPEPERAAGRDPRAADRKQSKENIKAALDRLLPRLDELRAAELSEMHAAGLGENQKPEAYRPMVETEGKLRQAIVPPLATLMIYPAITRSLIWVAGVVVTAALVAQAVARRVEARRVTDRDNRARSVELVQAELRGVAKELSRGRGIDAGALKGDLDQLTTDLFPPDE